VLLGRGDLAEVVADDGRDDLVVDGDHRTLLRGVERDGRIVMSTVELEVHSSDSSTSPGTSR
jgi:hypothetical protein